MVFTKIEKENLALVDADNLCIAQHHYYANESDCWKPAVILRKGYTKICALEGFSNLLETVAMGKELSAKMSLPLSISSKYTGCAETAGLKVR